MANGMGIVDVTDLRRGLVERDSGSDGGVLRDAVMLPDHRVSAVPDIVRANQPTP